MKDELNWSEKFSEDIKSDPISLDSTSRMAFDFLNLNGKNTDFDHFESFSGIFDASAFKLQGDEVGVRFWYCYDPSARNSLKFFLALEKITTHNEGVPEEMANMTENLIIPAVVGYSELITTPEDLEKHLKDKHFKQPRPNSNLIPKGKVLEFANNFRNLNRRLENDPSFPVGAFCKYVVAFFEKNAAYENFMRANPKYVAYVLGYINDNQHKPNLLRPILTRVGEDGKLILEDFYGEDIKSGSMLQRSTPPPPNT